MLSPIEFEQLCLKLRQFTHIDPVRELMAGLAMLPQILRLKRTNEHLSLLKEIILNSRERLAEAAPELLNEISLDVASFLGDFDFELLDGYSDSQPHTPLNSLAHVNITPIRQEFADVNTQQTRSTFWNKIRKELNAEPEAPFKVSHQSNVRLVNG